MTGIPKEIITTTTTTTLQEKQQTNNYQDQSRYMYVCVYDCRLLCIFRCARVSNIVFFYPVIRQFVANVLKHTIYGVYYM